MSRRHVGLSQHLWRFPNVLRDHPPDHLVVLVHFLDRLPPSVPSHARGRGRGPPLRRGPLPALVDGGLAAHRPGPVHDVAGHGVLAHPAGAGGVHRHGHGHDVPAVDGDPVAVLFAAAGAGHRAGEYGEPAGGYHLPHHLLEARRPGGLWLGDQGDCFHPAWLERDPYRFHEDEGAAYGQETGADR